MSSPFHNSVLFSSVCVNCTLENGEELSVGLKLRVIEKQTSKNVFFLVLPVFVFTFYMDVKLHILPWEDRETLLK